MGMQQAHAGTGRGAKAIRHKHMLFNGWAMQISRRAALLGSLPRHCWAASCLPQAGPAAWALGGPTPLG